MTRLSQNRRKILCYASILAVAWMPVGTTSKLGAQTAPKVDRIVVEKSKRTLTLMDGGKTVKTYKVALGGQPVGAKDRQEITKLPRVFIPWTPRTRTVSFTKHCIFPTQIRPTARMPENWASAPAAMWKFM